MHRILLALLAVGLVGCTTDTTYHLDGAFTQDRTDDDIEEVRVLVVDHGGEFLVRESFPEQFTAAGMEPDPCEDLRAILLEKEYLRDVGTCKTPDTGGGY